MCVCVCVSRYDREVQIAAFNNTSTLTHTPTSTSTPTPTSTTSMPTSIRNMGSNSTIMMKDKSLREKKRKVNVRNEHTTDDEYIVGEDTDRDENINTYIDMGVDIGVDFADAVDGEDEIENVKSEIESLDSIFQSIHKSFC